MGILESATIEGEFLEAMLPVKAFATLTTRHQAAVGMLYHQFALWIRAIQKHHRVTVGWVLSIESFPKRHIHAALVASIPIECDHAAALWQGIAAAGYSEAAKVKPYRIGRCGLGYVLKQLGAHGNEIRYSDNIAAFSARSAKSRFPTTPTQRRQQRRIRAQLSVSAQLPYSLSS